MCFEEGLSGRSGGRAWSGENTDRGESKSCKQKINRDSERAERGKVNMKNTKEEEQQDLGPTWCGEEGQGGVEVCPLGIWLGLGAGLGWGAAAFGGDCREGAGKMMRLGQAVSRSLRMSKWSWGPGEGAEQDWGTPTHLTYHVPDLLRIPDSPAQ